MPYTDTLDSGTRWGAAGEGGDGGAPRNVDIRLPVKGNSNSHGARPVHQIISMMKWIWIYRLSIENSLSGGAHGCVVEAPSRDSPYCTPYTPRLAPYTLHPTPYTLHPTPPTLHPTPYNLHPTAYSLQPTAYSLQPTPFTLHSSVRWLKHRFEVRDTPTTFVPLSSELGRYVTGIDGINPTPCSLQPTPYTL